MTVLYTLYYIQHNGDVSLENETYAYLYHLKYMHYFQHGNLMFFVKFSYRCF